MEITKGDQVSFQPQKKADRKEEPLTGEVLTVFTNKAGDTYVNIKSGEKKFLKKVESVTKI